MCQRVNCGDCGKPTFAGCGAHVEQVLGHVPRAERCKCREERAQGQTPKIQSKPSWLDSVLGKRP